MITEQLYKRCLNGKIRKWKLTQQRDGNYIATYGYLNGALQDSPVSKKEAESQYRHKKDREYYENRIPRYAPVRPMLAQKYVSGTIMHCDLDIQPKLDGLRCFASNKGLFTRKRQKWQVLDHIAYKLDELPDGVHLDGEIYIHGVPLQQIREYGGSNRVKPHPDEDLVEFHLYDVFDENDRGLNYNQRYAKLREYVKWNDSWKLTETIPLTSPAEPKTIDEAHRLFLSRGYEGSMLRNIKCAYICGRTYALLKYKTWEYIPGAVLGVELTEKGTAVGIVKTVHGDIRACFCETHPVQQELAADPPVGKQVIVRYAQLTEDGVPFHARIMPLD